MDPGWKKFGSGINIPDPQHWYFRTSRTEKVNLCSVPKPNYESMSVKTHLGDEYLTGVGRYSSEKSQSKNRIKMLKYTLF